MIIDNLQELVSHGNVPGRTAVLDMLKAGLRASDPYENVRKAVRLDGRKLIVGHEDVAMPADGKPLVFDLDKVGNIYVIGGGKASQRQAEALEDTLGDLITEGQVNAKKGDTARLKRIKVTLAGHPIPDEDSVQGARRILEIERKARKGDIVFHSESGGGSALLTLPAPGITLQDLQTVNRVLYFECGATMWDTNAVRNMLVLVRGREPRYVGEATYIRISTDERPPGLRIPPAGRDYTNRFGQEAYSYAAEILRRYRCRDRMPRSVLSFLEARDPQYFPISPEERQGKPWYHLRVMGPEFMLEAAQRRAGEMGITALIVASSLSDVEAHSAGEVLTYMAKEVEVYGRPVTPPCAFLCGGELVVTVGDGGGSGGRNQEFVLAGAPKIANSERIVIASADSDGSDGPTEAAGGIVDGLTMSRAEMTGMDVFDELAHHNAGSLLTRLGDTIHTGVRGTNVQDLRVVYVAGER